MTWTSWAMSSGPPICALRASARRISDSGFTGWPTPMAGTPAQKGYDEAGNTDSSRRTVSVWRTPGATDGEGGVMEIRPGKVGHYKLRDQAPLAGWPTPNTMEGGQTSRGRKRKGELLVGGLVRGIAAGPSNAPTEKPGVLNPAFSRWLMGFPAEWDDCAPTATPSSPKSPPRS
jgi:hypothetical protein